MANKRIPRRTALKGMGAIGAGAALASCATIKSGDREGPCCGDKQSAGAGRPAVAGDWREQIVKRVAETWFIDTHEHLPDEADRLEGRSGRAGMKDWGYLLSHYIDSDLVAAGLREADMGKVKSKDLDPMEKWRLVEPYWPAVKNTGYGQAVEIAVRDLYGIDGLNANTIARVQEEYVKLVQPGFYRKALQETARIDSCQVNAGPFRETKMPDLLLQDISFLAMHMSPGDNGLARPTGIKPADLDDWHHVIDWWFKKYGEYAVAVKSQAAYSRDVNFEPVKAEEAAPAIRKILAKEPASPEEFKKAQDHLFWYCVGKATEARLPIKIHTGYYAGQNKMTLDVVGNNPASISRVLRHAIQTAPDARFVLMHICYPYYEDMISLAKQYSNCYLDMCWAWIMNPRASTVFLKHYLMAAPANKIFTFGGDYSPVESVVGHAAIARRGIARALIELVEEDWLTVDAAMELIEPIMCGNARRVFDVEKKKSLGRTVPWLA
jgi:predicted TIM-barrel fold metal-dependent hydrolase